MTTLELSLIGVFLVAITVVIHAIGSTSWMRYILHHWTTPEGDWRPHLAMPAMISTAVVLLTLHVIQVMLWALTFLMFIPAGKLDSFEEAVYFSLVTFTTLGYGDITLSSEWRLLSGIEALNGILLVGWTTALLFAVVQRYWGTLAKQHRAR